MSSYRTNCFAKGYAKISLVFVLSLCDCVCFRYWHSGFFIPGRLRGQRQLGCVSNTSVLFGWRLVSLENDALPPSQRGCSAALSCAADTQPCPGAAASRFVSLQEKLLVVAAHQEQQWKVTSFDRCDWVSTFSSIFIFCKFLVFRPLILPIKQSRKFLFMPCGVLCSLQGACWSLVHFNSRVYQAWLSWAHL